MRFPRKLVASAVAGLIAGAGGMAVGQAATVLSNGGTVNLAVGGAEVVKCPNGLLTASLAVSPFTANCVAKPGSTTTTTQPVTTTTQPVTTTTDPSVTTTTAPPTSTTQPAAGGNCTDPVYTSSNGEASYNVDPSPAPENWWVSNDAWSGSAGPQTISVCNQSSWNVTANETNNQGQVETYPDTEYDVGGRDNPSTETIAQYNSITSTYSEAFPTGQGSWDAGYDLWTNNWSNETMVWNQYAGAQSFWFNQGTLVTIAGVQYHFVDNGNCEPVRCSGAGPDSGDELMFIAVNQSQAGSVDLLSIYNWEVANGYAKSTDVPTQLEYGVEICATTNAAGTAQAAETFPVTGLTFSLS